MSMIVLLAVCACQGPAPSDGPSWRVGFRVTQVEELPRGNWIESWPYDCAYTVSKTSEGIELQFDDSDGYVHPRVQLWLTPIEVRALASYGDCTSVWHGDMLAGTTCLISDGKDATFQFELYEGGAERFGRCLRGQAELGAAGVELAQRWTSPAPMQHHERLTYPCPGGFFQAQGSKKEFEASGMIDALGRRQGLWVVREVASDEPLMEAMWRNGLPHGLFREPVRVGQFQDGFQEGQEMIWFSDGRRHVSEYRHGVLREITNFDANGCDLGSPLSVRTQHARTDAHWDRISAFYTRR